MHVHAACHCMPTGVRLVQQSSASSYAGNEAGGSQYQLQSNFLPANPFSQEGACGPLLDSGESLDAVSSCELRMSGILPKIAIGILAALAVQGSQQSVPVACFLNPNTLMNQKYGALRNSLPCSLAWQGAVGLRAMGKGWNLKLSEGRKQKRSAAIL